MGEMFDPHSSSYPPYPYELNDYSFDITHSGQEPAPIFSPSNNLHNIPSLPSSDSVPDEVRTKEEIQPEEVKVKIKGVVEEDQKKDEEREGKDEESEEEIEYDDESDSSEIESVKVRTDSEGRILLEPEEVLQKYSVKEIDSYFDQCREIMIRGGGTGRKAIMKGILTNEENKKLRTIRKMIHNREYASNNRKKKKEETDKLKNDYKAACERIQVLETMVERYEQQITELKEENTLLRRRLSDDSDKKEKGKGEEEKEPPQKQAKEELHDVYDGQVEDETTEFRTSEDSKEPQNERKEKEPTSTESANQVSLPSRNEIPIFPVIALFVILAFFMFGLTVIFSVMFKT